MTSRRTPGIATAAAALAIVALSTAQAWAGGRSVPRSGQYFISHAAGRNEFTGGFVLHGNASITAVGITTNLIACVRPPSSKVQFPGPPNNWQPQKTIHARSVGGNLVFAYSGSFADRVNGYPESMQISATITPAGTVRGKVAMQMDDNTAASGEIKCQTRGFISFSGKRSA